MASQSPPQPTVLRVLLVRHAQSQNNAVAAKHYKDTTDANALASRVPDPNLTPLGMVQAQALASYYAKLQDTGIYAVWVSAMKRALQTAAPIASALNVPVIVRADVFEQGGVFEGEHRERVAEASTSSETTPLGLNKDGIGAELRRLGVQSISHDENLFPPGTNGEQGWYRSGYETVEAAQKRAHRVAEALWQEAERVGHAREYNWTRKRQYVDAQRGGPCLVIVAHGMFLDMLVRELLGIAHVEEPVPAPRRLVFPTCNTGRCTIDLTFDGFLRGSRAVSRRAASLAAWNALDHLPPVDGNALTPEQRGQVDGSSSMPARTGGSARSYQETYLEVGDA